MVFFFFFFFFTTILCSNSRGNEIIIYRLTDAIIHYRFCAVIIILFNLHRSAPVGYEIIMVKSIISFLKLGVKCIDAMHRVICTDNMKIAMVTRDLVLVF